MTWIFRRAEERAAQYKIKGDLCCHLLLLLACPLRLSHPNAWLVAARAVG
jgi:hypothetical protein